MYTYALIQTPETDLDLPLGIKSSLQLVGNQQISAIVEPGLNPEELQQDDAFLLQAVLAHDRVIQSLFLQTPLLPLRFGTFLPPEALRDHLTTRTTSYLQQLRQLAGKAEYILKFQPVEQPVTPPPIQAKGKEYFLAKKQQFQAQLEWQQQQQQQRQQLLLLAQAAFSRRLVVNLQVAEASQESQPGVEKVYLLIEQEREQLLQEEIQNWIQQCQYWAISLEGPLPPYHFISTLSVPG